MVSRGRYAFTAAFFVIFLSHSPSLNAIGWRGLLTEVVDRAIDIAYPSITLLAPGWVSTGLLLIGGQQGIKSLIHQGIDAYKGSDKDMDKFVEDTIHKYEKEGEDKAEGLNQEKERKNDDIKTEDEETDKI